MAEKYLKMKKNGALVNCEIEDASTPFSRFMGLQFRKSIPEDYGLLITPCDQIHMMNMRFRIDAVYISKKGKVIFVDRNVKRWIFCKRVKGARSVLELNSFKSDELGIKEGDILEFFKKTPENGEDIKAK